MCMNISVFPKITHFMHDAMFLLATVVNRTLIENTVGIILYAAQFQNRLSDIQDTL